MSRFVYGKYAAGCLTLYRWTNYPSSPPTIVKQHVSNGRTEADYLRDYATVPDPEDSLHRYCAFYNDEQPHRCLSYAAPGKVHQGLAVLLQTKMGYRFQEIVYRMEVTTARKRKQYTGDEKLAILRKHHLEGVAVSDICDEHDLQPTVFYR